MRAIKYLNTTPSACALYNKGVSDAVYTKDTLTKKNEKKKIQESKRGEK